MSEMMLRGAREANEESDRSAMSRDMGAAVGNLAAFIVAINRLTDRIEALEREVKELRRTPKSEEA